MSYAFAGYTSVIEVTVVALVVGFGYDVAVVVDIEVNYNGEWLETGNSHRLLPL